MNVYLRPLGPGELLDRAFHIYRKNFLLFLGVSLAWPGLVLMVEVASDVVIKSSPGLSSETIFGWIHAAVLAIFWALGWIVTQAAGTRAISALYLGENIGIRDAYKNLELGRVFRTSLLVFLYVFIVFLLFFFLMVAIMFPLSLLLESTQMFRSDAGRIFFVVSYIALMCGTLVGWMRLSARFVIAIPVSVLERKGAFASVKRSAALLKGGNSRATTLTIVMGLFALAGWFELVGPSMLVASITPETLGATGNLLLQQITTFCAQAFLMPVNTIWVALLYYDQRIRKEAFDIEFMMREASGAATELAAATAGTG